MTLTPRGSIQFHADSDQVQKRRQRLRSQPAWRHPRGAFASSQGAQVRSGPPTPQSKARRRRSNRFRAITTSITPPTTQSSAPATMTVVMYLGKHGPAPALSIKCHFPKVSGTFHPERAGSDEIPLASGRRQRLLTSRACRGHRFRFVRASLEEEPETYAMSLLAD